MPKQRVKVVPRNADCTTSYVLNSGVTEPNLTKFLQGVQKWLRITVLKSKLQSSNPFGNANVMNEDRRQIAAQIAAKTARFNSVNSEIFGQKWTANPFSNAEAKSKGRSTRRLRNLTGCHSHVPWATTTYINFVIPIHVTTYAVRLM